MLDAALEYYERGWFTIPLVRDKDGFPKKPISYGWSSLPNTLHSLRSLDWDHAVGIGVALGPVSGNLAVIDIDDVEMAGDVFARIVRSHAYCRMSWTVRKRLHVYCKEEQPSASRSFKVMYKGRECQVELKARGTQVAAPPTPGYVLACDKEPAPCTTVAGAWAGICKAAGITEIVSSGNFPRPWAKYVTKGDRDKSLYVEAHRLREAGMPIEQALSVLRTRLEGSYEAGLSWGEAERTIKSAYRDGPPPGKATYHMEVFD
jgi:hypothetical protein